MKLARLVPFLVLATACDFRPEDFARSRTAVDTFHDSWTKKIGDLSTRRDHLYDRAASLPAGAPGKDDVLTQLASAKTTLDEVKGKVSNVEQNAKTALDARHRQVAEDTLTHGEVDLRVSFDALTKQIDALERTIGAAETAAKQATPPTPPPAPPPSAGQPPPSQPPTPSRWSITDPQFAKGKGKAEVAGIGFLSGTDQLDLRKTPTTKPTLDQLVGFADQCDALRFNLIVHTAKDGRADDNQAISDKRAAALVKYLTSVGVAPEKIAKAYGVGGTDPLMTEPDPGTPEEKAMATDQLAQIRASNRRVTVEVVTPCPS